VVEKIKSTILIILVFSSLFLTYQLWYGQQPSELIAEDVYERIIVEKPRPLEEVFHPAYAAITVEGGYYLLNKNDQEFVEIWSHINKSLQLPSNELPDESEFMPEESVTLFTLYFRPGLPTGAEVPWLKDFPGNIVDEIKLKQYNSEMFLVSENSAEEFRHISVVSDRTKNSLLEILLNVYESDRNILFLLREDMFYSSSGRGLILPTAVFLPLEPVEISKIALANEDTDRDLLLKTFFVDYNLARIIEEKDGGLIYTDGEKGLRLTSDSLEYSNPRLEEGRATFNYAEALKNSNNLISYHGGWPEGLQLESLASTGWGNVVSYVAQWRMFVNGYPLYTLIPTKVIFNDRGLVHYSRSLYFPTDPEVNNNDDQITTSEWSEALDAAVKIYEEELPGLSTSLRLEAMHLAYAVNASCTDFYGEPVWYVQMSGKSYLLKADTLTRINEEALK